VETEGQRVRVYAESEIRFRAQRLAAPQLASPLEVMPVHDGTRTRRANAAAGLASAQERSRKFLCRASTAAAYCGSRMITVPWAMHATRDWL